MTARCQLIVNPRQTEHTCAQQSTPATQQPNVTAYNFNIPAQALGDTGIGYELQSGQNNRMEIHRHETYAERNTGSGAPQVDGIELTDDEPPRPSVGASLHPFRHVIGHKAWYF